MSQTDNSSDNRQFDSSLGNGGTRRSGKKKFWVALVLLLLAGAGGKWYWDKNQVKVAENLPLLATVDRGDIENAIASAGTLKPSHYIDVGAQVSGQLQKLHVEVGDVVTEGQLLAEIDARVQASRVEASRASIEAQEAQLDARKAALNLAQANAARQERLREGDATSQLEYDTALNNLASAQSSLIQLEKQIEQSRASLMSEETQLEFTNIFAPAEGTVVSIEMNEGRTLNASQQAPTILRIADLSTMTVEADISEADIASIRKGMDVYFTTLGGGERRWYAKLRQILPTPSVENNVVLYTGLFDIENTDSSLFSEMTAQVYFVTSQAHDVLTIPLGAVSFSQMDPARMTAGGAPGAGGVPATPPQGAAALGRGAPGQARVAGGRRPATVTVVKDDGRQETREVIIGVTSRVAAEVVSGLTLGEKVIAGIKQSSGAAGAGGAQGGNFRMMGGAGRF